MSCCVVGCTNRFDKNNKTRKFYGIPSTRTPFKANRRRLWLQAIRRSDWNEQIIKNALICSDHFKSGKASEDIDSPDFVPSIFPYNTQSGKGSKGKMERYKRKRKRDEAPSRCPGNGDRSTHTAVSSDDTPTSASSNSCGMEHCADFRTGGEDSTSGHHCCVPQCTASATFNSVISFHTFPTDLKLHKRWLFQIRRNNFTTTNNTRVCSRHFQSTDLIEPSTPTGRRRLRPGAIPLLFPWNGFSLRAPGTEDPRHDHNYCSAAGSDLDHAGEPRADITSRLKLMEETSLCNRFGLERFAASDDDIRFYTRFAGLSHLMAFWRQIEPETHKMACEDGARTALRTDQDLNTIDEFFLFMTYLSLGLQQKDLADRFKTRLSAVSRIINTWANFLYAVLGAVGIWLSEEDVKTHLPDVFKNIPDTQVVLGCTELRCQAPKCPPPQALSDDEHHLTFRGLVGMAPHGAVTFVSSLYEGSVSDKEILKKSGIVSLLKPTAAVMVDGGFPVEDCVPCKVYMSQTRLRSVTAVKKTQCVDRLRVHVEQLIGRVKEQKIFSTVIPLSLTGSVNQLYAVACLLVNYQN